MKKTFSHFSKSERYEIAILRNKKYSYAHIAEAMGRAASAVWNEIHRNRVRGSYIPKKAHHKAYVRRKYAKYQGKKIVHNEALR